MTWFMVDVEADGPIPGDFSMISFGAVIVEPKLDRTFKATLCPISENWIPEALAVSRMTREQVLKAPQAKDVMLDFRKWVETNSVERPRFISDNNGFDWMWICWYLHHFTLGNPFGHSSTNLGSLYKGMARDMRKNFKHLRRTRHDHDPLNDARGNAEALLAMRANGLRMNL